MHRNTIVFLLVLVCGCGPKQPPRPTTTMITHLESVPKIPEPSHVFIKAEKLMSDPIQVQWRWTIVGDLRWMQTPLDSNSTALEASLQSTIPNTDQITGGNNVWQLVLTLRKADQPDGSMAVLTTFSLQGVPYKIVGPKIDGNVGAQMNVLEPSWIGPRAAIDSCFHPLLVSEKTSEYPCDFDLGEITIPGDEKHPGVTQRVKLHVKR